MPLYVVVNADGTQQRVAPSPLELGNGNQVLVFNDLQAEPNADTHRWNPALLAYELLPSAPEYVLSRTQLTKREFRARLGQPCRMAINARLITPPANAQETDIVAGLQDLKDELLSVDAVDLTHPSTIGGVQFLVALGYLTPTQAEAVLAPSTVAAE
ncbi:MAG: hypothetical protein ACRC1H_09685 [Caldilineaceae bacterium]